MSKGWDSGMLKKLKSLIGKGLSTAEMGKKLGMSKNAVVGKLNRLGWNAKASGEEKKSVAKPKKETKTSVKKPAKPAVLKKTAIKVEKKNVKKEPTKKENKNVKSVAKVATKASQSKTPNKETPVIKTASKKTKKDMALHELLIQHALQMANLKSNQCRWPIGDPDSENFHFCGEQVFAGKPYCYEHCRQAYQFTPPKKK